MVGHSITSTDTQYLVDSIDQANAQRTITFYIILT